MTLYMIGIGLGDEKDITVKGLEIVKKCDKVYLESYTSVLGCDVERLEEFYGKKIIIADRELVEQKAEETILKDAKEGDAAFLVIGDVFGATTHVDLKNRAKEIKVVVIHNASILTAIGDTGLELYKFGKVTSIPFHRENVMAPYTVLENNKKIGLHTLFLLDLDPQEKKFLKIGDALGYLLACEGKEGKNVIDEDTLCIGCAGLGTDKVMIKSGKTSQIKDIDFGEQVQCLIIPGELHFVEEENLKNYSQ